jgi:zinc-binding alcohol dehydrogenase family protein
MKAIGYHHGGPLQDLDLPAPTASGHDLLVRVEAISVNPVDTKVRRGGADAQVRVLGWDAVGVVQATGEQVTLFRPGDRVWYAGAIGRPGANSELHLVDERIAAAAPTTIDAAAAAALPLTAITAWEALFTRLGIDPHGGDAGKTLLVVAGAGGVGSIAIQLAAQVAGLTVVASASRPESAAWARDMGARHIVYHSGDMPSELHGQGIEQVDFILCATGINEHFPALAEMLAPQGKIAAIVTPTAPLPMELLFAKSGTLVFELMFTRSMFHTPDMQEQHRLLTEVARLVDAGTLRSTANAHFGRIDAANLQRAHDALESGRTIGKIVLAGF